MEPWGGHPYYDGVSDAPNVLKLFQVSAQCMSPDVLRASVTKVWESLIQNMCSREVLVHPTPPRIPRCGQIYQYTTEPLKCSASTFGT